MPVAGLVNQIFPGPASTALLSAYPNPTFRTIVYDNAFVNFFRFLSGTCAPLGVRLRAFHTGSGSPNGGMNPISSLYKPHGDHAWYTFEFTQANPPFWIHVWQGLYSNFDTGGVASPALSEGGDSGNNRHMSIATACRSDGGCPWNGSTSSNGYDTKGTPVWSATAGGGSGTLYVFPRSNNPGGAHNTNKENTAGAFTDYNESLSEYASGHSRTTMAHFFAGPDWYTLFNDLGGRGVCYWDHFGGYIPQPALSGTYPKYLMANFKGRFSNGHGTMDNFFHEEAFFQGFGALNGQGFDNGGTFGGSGQTNFDPAGVSTGGITNPLTSSPGNVRTAHWSMPSIWVYTMQGVSAGNFATTGSTWIEEWSPYLYIGETPYGTGSAGFVGVAKDIKLAGGGVQHMALNPQKTKIAIHCLPYGSDGFSYSETMPYHLSFVMPWTGSLYPYRNMSIGGSEFYIP